MTCRSARAGLAVLACALTACLAPAAARAQAHPRVLPDSTWVDRWTLANGLQVTVRHIPRAFGVCAVTAYHVGRNQDPKEHAGLADLLREVHFTAAAGEVPARTRRQLDDLRSLGWKMQVAPRFTLFSEVASASRFPGMLRQVAARMRGVTVNDSVLEQARRAVVSDNRRSLVDAPDEALFQQLRDVAEGVTDEELTARLTGQTIRNVTAREAEERLRRLYVPANAVLALAGNLEGVDVHKLVSNLFESIPGGTPQPEPPSPPLKSAGRGARHPAIERALGGVAIIAPAITDTLSADFFLNSLVIASFGESKWGPARSPLTARYRYPIFADPDLAQYFPPVAEKETDPDQLGISMQDLMEELAETSVTPQGIEEQRLNYQWFFGGPFMLPMRRRAEQHPGTLQTLASTMAVRALWASDEYWDRYLKRFMNRDPRGGADWTEYFESPAHIVRLLLTPAKP